MKTLTNFILTSCMLLLASCSSLKTQQKNTEALSKIKRVAIIGFTAVQPVASTLDPLKPQEGNFITGSAKHVDQMWKQLSETIAQKTKWQVISFEQMKQHPAYKEAYKQTMEGWQNKMPPGQGLKQYGVQSVMDFDSLRILKPDEKKKLMERLHVDALLVAKISVNFYGTTVMGIGDRYPKASVTIQASSLDSENSIWFETFKGEQSDKSVGKTNFFDEEILARGSIESANSAFNKIKL